MNTLLVCFAVLLGASGQLVLPGSGSGSGSGSFNTPPEPCGTNEVWTSCSSSSCFERVCDVPQETFCTRDCKKGCKCMDGYARSKAGKCVKLDECAANTPSPPFGSPPQPCPQNETWTSCSSSSCFEHRCDTAPSLLCTRDCKMGCKCLDGFARLGNRCINETACPDLGFRSLDLFPTKPGKGKPTPVKTSPPTMPPGKKIQLHREGNRTLYVSGHRANCTHGEGLCLLTRYNPLQMFLPVVRQIKGFEYQEGFTWELLVEARKKGALKKLVEYELIKVVNKTRAGKAKAKAKAKAKGPSPKGMFNCTAPGQWTWAQEKLCCAQKPELKRCKSGSSTAFVSTPKAKAKGQ